MSLVANVPQEHDLKPRTVEAHDRSEVTLNNIRVLAVDDDPEARDVLQQVLEDSDASVDTVSSGRSALQRLAEDTYDIIISDISMPEMDGYELMRMIRSRGNRTPAIAVTALGRSEDRTRSLECGYNMHVTKPVDPRELMAMIAALLRADHPR